jgi:hypothetical protein
VFGDKGEESLIHVSGTIESFDALAPLREPLLPGARRRHGTGAVWTNETDMSADALWRLAQKQSGATMTPDEF